MWYLISKARSMTYKPKGFKIQAVNVSVGVLRCGCTEETKPIRSNRKENTAISDIDAQRGRTLSLRYFGFLLLHHAGSFENLGEDRPEFMPSGRDAIFSLLISFSFNPIQHERRHIDKIVPNHVEQVLRRTCVPGRVGGGGGFCCCIYSILFILIQDKSLHIGKHVGWQALRVS